MDLDAILPLLIIFFFFILPNLLKALKKKKKKPEQKRKSQEKAGWFGKIGEQIAKVLQEIENQQKLQEKSTGTADDFWQTLAAEDEQDFYPPEPPAGKKVLEPPIILEPEPKKSVKQKEPLKVSTTVLPARMTGPYRQQPLQNAVIWSEILGKPVALK